MRKIALWLIVIDAVLWLMHIPKFGNGLMEFVMLGVNPVTNQPFTSTQLICVLVAVFLLAFELIFHKYVARFFRAALRGFRSPTVAVDAVAQVAPATVAPAVKAIRPAAKPAFEPIVLPKRSGRRQKTKRQLVLHNLRASLREYWKPKVKAWHAGQKRGRQQMSLYQSQVSVWRQYQRSIWVPRLKWVVRLGFALAIVAAVVTGQSLLAAWRFVAPYIARADAYFAKQLHTNDRGYFLRAAIKESKHLLRGFWRTWMRLQDTATNWVKNLGADSGTSNE